MVSKRVKCTQKFMRINNGYSVKGTCFPNVALLGTEKHLQITMSPSPFIDVYFLNSPSPSLSLNVKGKTVQNTSDDKFFGMKLLLLFSQTKSCPTLCNPMECSRPGFSVPHHLLEFAQLHVHCIYDATHPSHLMKLELSIIVSVKNHSSQSSGYNPWSVSTGTF